MCVSYSEDWETRCESIQLGNRYGRGGDLRREWRLSLRNLIILRSLEVVIEIGSGCDVLMTVTSPLLRDPFTLTLNYKCRTVYLWRPGWCCILVLNLTNHYFGLIKNRWQHPTLHYFTTTPSSYFECSCCIQPIEIKVLLFLWYSLTIFGIYITFLKSKFQL